MTTTIMRILFGLIAGYFLAAAFIPKIRARWGTAKGRSWTWSKSDVTRETYSRRAPRMGVISSLGFATFFGGFLFLPQVGCTVGLILLVTGAVLDWLREPPITTRKKS